MSQVRAFSLLELIIVLMVVAVIASVAVPGYFQARERAIDREAQTMLNLIRAAEKSKRMETGSFVACTDTTDCNTELSLSLPDSASANWDYDVYIDGGGNYRIRASRLPGPGTIWDIPLQ